MNNIPIGLSVKDVSPRSPIVAIESVQSGKTPAASIGKLPPEVINKTGGSGDLVLSSKVANTKPKGTGGKPHRQLTNQELADISNDHTKNTIIRFNDRGQDKINILRDLPNGKTALLAANRNNGHYIVTYFKDDANKNNYFRDLAKNKNAEVVYGSGSGAATSPTALRASQMGLVGATRDSLPKTAGNVKPTPEDALKQEALKYKTPEEFVEANRFGGYNEAEVEAPVREAVATIPKTNSSGFHEGFSRDFNGLDPSWAIIIEGKPDNLVSRAATKAGLKTNTRETVRGNPESTVTDIYLPDVKQQESKRASEAFGTLADNYRQQLTDLYHQAHAEAKGNVKGGVNLRPAKTASPETTSLDQTPGVSQFRAESSSSSPTKNTTARRSGYQGGQVESNKTSIANNTIKDAKLKELSKVRKEIINAEARTILDTNQPTRNLAKEIREAGGISSSSYESFPNTVKNKNGLSADVMARDLGFSSENEIPKRFNLWNLPVAFAYFQR